MKNFTLSVATVLAMSAFATAGGDIAPVEPMVEAVAPAQDDSGFYIGGAFGLSNTSVDWNYASGYDGIVDYTSQGNYERDQNAYMLQAGYKFNQYIAIEGRYWDSMDTSSWSDSNSNGGSWSNSDGDWNAWGIYAKPMYPVTETVDVYALLGYGNVTVKDKWWDSDMLDENVFQWGIGASYEFTENASFFIDYVQLCSDEGGSGAYTDGWYFENETWETTIYTVNVGLSYKF